MEYIDNEGEIKIRDPEPKVSLKQLLIAQEKLVLAKRELWLLEHPETKDKHVYFQIFVYDTSDEACAPFGFHYGDYVSVKDEFFRSHTLSKLFAWVLGVFNNELYFIMEEDPNSAKNWKNFKKVDFLKYGFRLFLPYVRETSLSTVQKDKYYSPDLLKLLNEPEKSFSDVIFCVNGDIERIYAHRNIISARSEYFNAMFRSGMQETSQEEVQIKMDTDTRSFRSMLEYLYTGDLDFNKCSYVNYLITAQMFQIEELTKLCYQYIDRTNQITLINVVHLLARSDEHQLNDLRDMCLRFIWSNYNFFTQDQRMTMITDLKINTLNEILGGLQQPQPQSQLQFHEIAARITKVEEEEEGKKKPIKRKRRKEL